MKKHLPSFFPLGNDTGSVMVLVLWAVIFLALLTAAVSSHVAARMRLALSLEDSFKAQAVAERVLEETVTILQNDATPAYDALDEPWATTFELVDEERYVNLNSASSAMLVSLFQAVGELPAGDAQALAKSLVAWRSDAEGRDDGSKIAEACSDFHMDFGCKGSPFESLEELLWHQEISPFLFEKLCKELTLFGSGRVNVNTATAAALRSFGLSSGTAEAIAASTRLSGAVPIEDPGKIVERLQKDQHLTNEEVAQLQSAVSQGLLSVRSDAYRRHMTVTLGAERKREIDFVVNRNGELKAWQEH